MKQTATTGGSEKGKPKTSIETKTRLSYNQAWEQNVDDIQKKYKDKAAYIADREGERKKDPVAFEEGMVAATGVSGGPGTVTSTKTEEGDDLDYNADLYKTKEDKVVQGPSNTRMQERSGVFTSRKVNKYERQMGRYGDFNMDGEFTARTDLSQREMRKLRQAQRNLDRAKSASANVQSGVDSGTGLKGKYYGGQRKMDKGELTKPEQKEQALREAKQERKRQSEGAIDAMPVNPFANMATLNVPAITAPSVNYMDLLKSSPTKMKKGYTQKAKSPATKALKGAQNTLPQHLQDAIKAAPGKMRGPLKKGYFKGV